MESFIMFLFGWLATIAAFLTGVSQDAMANWILSAPWLDSE